MIQASRFVLITFCIGFSQKQNLKQELRTIWGERDGGEGTTDHKWGDEMEKGKQLIKAGYHQGHPKLSPPGETLEASVA